MDAHLWAITIGDNYDRGKSAKDYNEWETYTKFNDWYTYNKKKVVDSRLDIDTPMILKEGREAEITINEEKKKKIFNFDKTDKSIFNCEREGRIKSNQMVKPKPCKGDWKRDKRIGIYSSIRKLY